MKKKQTSTQKARKRIVYGYGRWTRKVGFRSLNKRFNARRRKQKNRVH